MTEKYTPEKVAELVADTRDHADYMRRVWGDDAEVRDDSRLFDRLADALTALSAERDSFKHQAEHFAMRGNIAEADRDRLHKAITEALDELGDPEGKGPWLSGNIPNAVRRILRAALEQEGSDDE